MLLFSQSSCKNLKAPVSILAVFVIHELVSGIGLTDVFTVTEFFVLVIKIVVVDGGNLILGAS